MISLQKCLLAAAVSRNQISGHSRLQGEEQVQGLSVASELLYLIADNFNAYSLKAS